MLRLSGDDAEGRPAAANMAIPGRTVRRYRMLMNRARLRRLATCAVVVVATAACGGDSSPTTPFSLTAPSPQPQIPNVAGTYRGPLTITAALEGGAVMVSLSGTMHITVVQAGAQLTITGSTTILDETSALEAVTGTVDDTGRVTFPPDSIINAAPIPMGDDTCGTLTPAPAMLTFSGTTARFLQTASSDGCGTVEIVSTLTRQ